MLSVKKYSRRSDWNTLKSHRDKWHTFYWFPLLYLFC